MAEHLASIFGAEKDRVNCPFYSKTRACRHGEQCSRLHTKPRAAVLFFLSSMYRRSDMITSGVDALGNPIYPLKIQRHFEELSKYGEIGSLNVCDNLADHMFREQEGASNALQDLTGRASEGFSTVTGFCEATWIHEENVCNRGGYCNWQLS